MVGSIGAIATASVAISTSTVWLINGFITALSVGASYLVSHAIGEGDREKTESSVRQSMTAMISGLGTVPLAAHYLTNQTEGLLYLPAYGFAYTATTLIGQSLGAQDRALAKRFAKNICLISSSAIILACIPVYIFAGNMIDLFTGDPEVLHLGTMTLKIAAATEIFFSFFIVASGIFRGSGDVKFPLYVTIIGMWGLRVGLVWIVVNVLHWGVVGVWIAIEVDCCTRTLLCIWRLINGKWMEVPHT